MNILGINPFHNGSVCILSNGKVIEYIEEERLTRKKYDELPFKSILNFINKYSIDDIAIAGLIQRRNYSSFFNEEILKSFFTKLNFHPSNIHYFDHIHHQTHIATAFYNSKFKESIGIVIDAGGSIQSNNESIEQDTIFYCSYPNNFHFINQNFAYLNIPPQQNPLGIGQSFQYLCYALGLGVLDGGKIMGLASYGNPNNNLPKLFKKNNTNINYINYQKLYQDFFPEDYNIDWHHDKSKITDLEKDLSWKLQTESQTILGDYIEKAIQETKLNNVVVAGGYGLNCVANYYLKKRFPKINFYFEPISHDGGTAIGAAKLLWHQKTNDTTIRPQKTLYYGPEYTKEQLLEGLKKYV
jgi:carbamoyltransferase